MSEEQRRDEEEDFATRYEAGDSIRTIARDNSLQYSLVRNRLLDAGVKLRRPGPPRKADTAHEQARAAELQSQGLTLRQIADVTGWSYGRVHTRLNPPKPRRGQDGTS